MTRQYVSYGERVAPSGRRYLLAEIIDMAQDERGVWFETGAREALASFPAPMHGSPWNEGTQRPPLRLRAPHHD